MPSYQYGDNTHHEHEELSYTGIRIGEVAPSSDGPDGPLLRPHLRLRPQLKVIPVYALEAITVRNKPTKPAYEERRSTRLRLMG